MQAWVVPQADGRPSENEVSTKPCYTLATTPNHSPLGRVQLLDLGLLEFIHQKSNDAFSDITGAVVPLSGQYGHDTSIAVGFYGDPIS